MGERGARLTGASENFQEDVVARLEPLGGITSRKMFGGFGIFHDGAMFGIISKRTLYFKADESTRSDFEKAGSKQHKPMPYWAVPPTVVVRKASLHKWASKAISVAHAAKPATKKKTKAASKK